VSAIAITGVGGSLGGRLVRQLVAELEPERIVGIDRSAPEGLTAPRFSFLDADPGTADLRDALAGVDVVIHLAEVLEPVRDDALVRTREVDAARRVVEAAHAAGVPRLVLSSSVLAYGAHPDNDVPLHEESALRATPGLASAEHVVEVERWLAGWRSAHPELSVAVLRFALLAGPDLDTALTRAFEAPRLPAVRGHRPPLQFLHPDDAVTAIVHAVEAELEGAYNVCADGWLSYDEVAALVGRRSLEVPEELAYSGAAGVYALRLGDLPPGIVSLFVHPCVMRNEKLKATGWQPRYSNRDAVATLVAEHGPFVTIGRVRARWSTLWRSGAVVSALLVAGVVRLMRARRRRRRSAEPGDEA
jgi:nucleoside-diphosphate-sugar epimerase